MPFFKNCNTLQVQSYCDKQTNESLTGLVGSIEQFINRCTVTIATRNDNMRVLVEQLRQINDDIDEIKSFNVQVDQYNAIIMSSLPGNGAERYLAMQQLTQPRNPISLYSARGELFKQLRDLNSRKNRLEGEKRACQQELDIVKYTLAQRDTLLESTSRGAIA